MAGQKSKAKGKRFENEIAENIVTSFGINKNMCYRAPCSGNGKFEYGDIYFANPEFCGGVVLECKNVNSWDIRSIFPKLNALMCSWVDEHNQAIQKYVVDNKHNPRYTGIVFTKPYYPSYILSACDFPLAYKMYVGYGDGLMFVYTFSEFLNHMLTSE